MNRKARLQDLERRITELEKNVVGSAEPPAPVVLAHILSPAAKLPQAIRGGKPTSLCGTVIEGNAAADSNVCRQCFDLNVARQEAEAKQWMTQEREAGKTQGVAEGRATTMQEIRDAAEQRATELAAAS